MDPFEISKNITVRLATIEDRGDVAQFVLKSYLDLCSYDPYEYLHQLEIAPGVFKHLYNDELFLNSIHLMCFNQQKLIATAGLTKDEEPNAWKLVSVYVSPDYQRQGIGEHLVKQILDIALDLDINKITLCTLKNQMAGACKLYEKLNFTLSKEVVTKPPRTMIYMYYEKHL